LLINSYWRGFLSQKEKANVTFISTITEILKLHQLRSATTLAGGGATIICNLAA